MRQWIDLMEATVWHGSPHRFEAFDIQKINSGEGNQAYGWGLYLAQEKMVADYYRKTLSNIVVDGRPATDEERAMVADKLAQEWSIEDIATYIDGTLTFEGGHLYEVEIPADENFLIWDSPLSQQSLMVKSAIRKIHMGVENRRVDLKRYVRDCIEDDNDGHVLYHHIGNWARNVANMSWEEYRKVSSMLLLKAGIVGIRYPDMLSREEGENDTANYVVFDSKHIKIIATH